MVVSLGAAFGWLQVKLYTEKIKYYLIPDMTPLHLPEDILHSLS